MDSFGKTYFSWLCAVIAALAFAIAPAHAALGDYVENQATVAYAVEGSDSLSFTTNVAAFMIEAQRTPSEIEFFRVSPLDPEAFTTQINGSDYSPSGQGGDFVRVGPPTTVGGFELDLSGEVSLSPATRYLAGELLIVRVVDRGQNGDPDVIETVEITISADGADEIRLRLYESGPDTGEFYAYAPSSREETPANDPVLTTLQDTTLTATYVDRFDEAEVSVDTALIDPFGRVFDSLTGEVLDGVAVTIVDAATGQPAPVYGVDGVSEFPSTLVTGSRVTDESGLVYELEPGEFLFPLMPIGEYRIVVSPPAKYLFPSSQAAETFTALENAPFEIIDASYGGSFVLDLSGPLNFDVPLDPAGELVVIKTAGVQTASIGDFVGYTITVENKDIVPAPMIVRDELPAGLRYEAGTARLNGAAFDEVSVDGSGRSLTFTAGSILPGERKTITYVAAVGAGAPNGEAVNEAVAVNSAGAPISNRAEAGVLIREDLLRSKLTIIGRVAHAACDADENWAKHLDDGVGVEGVRIYMETGEYVVTDQDGLYHFQGVDPGTHVLQVDEETLPEGFEPMVCEENSRYAGSAYSKFVDASGGVVWRANFYLKQVYEAAAAKETADFDDVTEYLDYGPDWIDAQTPETEWVYPAPGSTPSSPSVSIGIKHAGGRSVSLSLNGEKVPGLNFAGRDLSLDRSVEISRWRGVDILKGRNLFIAEVRDRHGELVERFEREIWYVDQVARATLVADQSRLVADGRTAPVVAVRLEDQAGRPVREGRIVEIDVQDPYRLRAAENFEREQEVTALVTTNAGVPTGAGGVARVELSPTLLTGKVRLTVRLDGGRVEEIDAYLQPEERDWIVVGVGSVRAGFEAGGPEANSLDPVRDDRIALFAKGMVKGDWLLTLAIDTAKRRGSEDEEIFQRIDPNAYYTLYGDETYQYSDAESRYPVYVKLEKETVQLLFGDYDTDLGDTELGRYGRRLSGVRGVYEASHVSVTGFAAETDQGFVKDEIAADGTSGPYLLGQAPLVRNSEIVVVETRNRLRPDEIVETRSYARYADYEIDYLTGEIIFRHPVNATDAAFNPNVIVVDYEVFGGEERNLAAGGRAAVRPLGDDRVEAGVTYLREEGDAEIADRTSDLVAVDVSVKLSQNTEARAEAATSSQEVDGEGGELVGDAYLAEVLHTSARLRARAYVREDGEGFGLGQQGAATQGLRRYGAEGSLRVGEPGVEAGDGRIERFVDGQVYEEEALADDASRSVAEAALRAESALLSASTGLRQAEETYADGETRRSVLATGALRRTFAQRGLTLTASHEEPLFDGDDEATNFPQRTIFGADKTVTQRATLNLRHEIVNGADASGQNTIAGVTVTPWRGAEARASTDVITQDSARRIGATVGVDQTIQFNEYWTGAVGAAHRARIDGGDAPRDVTADAAVSPLEDAVRSPLAGEEGYTSLYAGAGFNTSQTAVASRVETRSSELGDRVVGVFGAAREASETLSFAGAGRVQYEGLKAQEDRRLAEARLGAAWRPRGEGPVVYNRLDLVHEETFEVQKSWKIVNNFSVNAMATQRTQLAGFHGVKYVETSFDHGVEVSGITHLFGGEVRHDVTKRWDVGLTASALRSSATGTMEYSYGPSIGVSPAKNVWASVGYNVEGFTDRDFEAAEYSREGLYLKLRVKFDQNTIKGFLDRISPKGG